MLLIIAALKSVLCPLECFSRDDTMEKVLLSIYRLTCVVRSDIFSKTQGHTICDKYTILKALRQVIS